MNRVIAMTQDGITANLEADRIEESGDFFIVYNDEDIVGVFEMGIVLCIYKTKVKEYVKE